MKARAEQLRKEWNDESRAKHEAFQAKSRVEATRELTVQKQLEPYLVRLAQLQEEAKAQNGERIAHDRLPPDELRAFDPATTNEDIAAANAWRQRRAGRRQDIVQWLEDIGDDLGDPR